MSSPIADQIIANYSDLALKGAIRALERMINRGEWGELRLQQLKAERDRRQKEDQDR